MSDPQRTPLGRRWRRRQTSAHDVLRVVVPYVIVTALWIYLSDDLVRRLAGDVSTSAFWSTLKGFFFIAVTGDAAGDSC